jgi:hypothetical protein
LQLEFDRGFQTDRPLVAKPKVMDYRKSPYLKERDTAQHKASQRVTVKTHQESGLWSDFLAQSPLPSVQIATLLSDFVGTNLGTQTVCGFQKT